MSAGAQQAKRCNKCKEVKSLDEFHKNKSSRDGLQGRCKPCVRETVAGYKAANRGKVLAAGRAYAARVRAEDPEKHRARGRLYDAAYLARMRTERPEAYRERWTRDGNLRRARMADVAHESYSRADIFAAYANECVYCGSPAEHLDHVVAISKGGPDAAHNLLPACAPCNLSKSDKSLAEWTLTWLS